MRSRSDFRPPLRQQLILLHPLLYPSNAWMQLLEMAQLLYMGTSSAHIQQHCINSARGQEGRMRNPPPSMEEKEKIR